MRELIYIPMIHDFVREGDPELEEIFLRLPEIQRTALNYIRDTILPEYWKDVRGFVSGFKIDKVYAESIISDYDVGHVILYARKGFKVFQAIEELICKGAKLTATEHLFLNRLSGEEIKSQANGIPTLKELGLETVLKLLEVTLEPSEYQLVKELTEGETEFDSDRLRDKYIARRIDSTLKDGERGILLLGRNHSVDDLLEEKKSGIHIVRYRSKYDGLSIVHEAAEQLYSAAIDSG